MIESRNIKAVTKTVRRALYQRAGGWCEPVLDMLIRPIPSEPEARTRKSVGVSRECCVNAQGLLDSDEGQILHLQFEWYREC